jgi:hypothetical protein
VRLQNITANQIVIWCALLLGLLGAVVIGSSIGNADMRMVAGVIALIPAVIIFFKLKTNIWVLLPIGWYLDGRLPWLPLPLSIRDLCFLAVIVAFALFAATRVVHLKRKPSMLDYLIYINLAYLVTVYVRNPAGIWFLQSNIVGGRPYFDIALAFGGFLILSRVQITDFIAKMFPLFFVIPAWSVAMLDTVGRVNPQVGYALNSLYSAVGPSAIGGTIEGAAEIGTTRITPLAPAGTLAVLALCARYNPITLISPLNPGRAVLFVLALGAIFLSGFRGSLLSAFAFLFLAVILRRQLRHIWTAGGIGILLIAVLISLQGTVLQMPLTMQRSLSWLPGDWDQAALRDAEGSTEWRVDMWVWAWNDELVLRDKVWGQGFGVTIEDMQLIARSLLTGGGGSTYLGGSDREQFMITGTFHSGPLSSIKYVGMVGLVLFVILMCYMSVLAWRLCKQAWGTKGFSLALFIGIPIIYDPFVFMFIFGALEDNYPTLLFKAGLLSMAQRYVENLNPTNMRTVKAGDHIPTAPVSEIEPVLKRQRFVPRSLQDEKIVLASKAIQR